MPHALAEEVAADARRYVLGACSAYGDCKLTSLCFKLLQYARRTNPEFYLNTKVTSIRMLQPQKQPCEYVSIKLGIWFSITSCWADYDSVGNNSS